MSKKSKKYEKLKENELELKENELELKENGLELKEIIKIKEKGDENEAILEDKIELTKENEVVTESSTENTKETTEEKKQPEIISPVAENLQIEEKITIDISPSSSPENQPKKNPPPKSEDEEENKWKTFFCFKPKAKDWAVWAFEALFLIVVISLDATLLDKKTWADNWYMPFLGVFGATVGMSTPAGGGIIFFPVLELLHKPILNAVAFSVATQMIGMGVFGTIVCFFLNWLRNDPNKIDWRVLGIILPFCFLTVSISFFFIKIYEVMMVRMIFAGFCLLLVIFIIIILRRGFSSLNNKLELNKKSVTILIITGLTGGILVGFIGTGIDALIFFSMAGILKVDPQTATVTSILSMGYTAALASIFHFVIAKDVIIPLWSLAIPGLVIGARLGTFLNIFLGRFKMLVLFCILLMLEVIRTAIDFFKWWNS